MLWPRGDGDISSKPIIFLNCFYLFIHLFSYFWVWPTNCNWYVSQAERKRVLRVHSLQVVPHPRLSPLFSWFPGATNCQGNWGGLHRHPRTHLPPHINSSPPSRPIFLWWPLELHGVHLVLSELSHVATRPRLPSRQDPATATPAVDRVDDANPLRLWRAAYVIPTRLRFSFTSPCSFSLSHACFMLSPQPSAIGGVGRHTRSRTSP
jgi:hypothetical protein